MRVRRRLRSFRSRLTAAERFSITLLDLLVEAGLLPALIDPVWNTSAVLSEASPLGILLRTLFGYNADPTLLEVIAYAAYFAAVLVAQRAMRDGKPAPAMATG